MIIPTIPPRRLRALLTLSLLAIAHSVTLHAQTVSGWTQTFADEFNGTSLDTTKWNTTFMWSGAGARTLPDNGELQVYRDNQFEFANGILRIRADRQDNVWQGKTYPYVSGLITTYQKFAQQRGYFEIRARLPQGKGLWPAFWMLLNRTQWPPEIDILEVLGDKPTITYHTVISGVSGSTYHRSRNTFDTSAAFHVFGLEWTDTQLSWYIDGRLVSQGPRPADLTENMQLLANLAVGGNWPGSPNASTVFPAYLDIDYIRAWRRDTTGVDIPFLLGHTVGSTGVAGATTTNPSATATVSGSGTGYQPATTADNLHYAARLMDGDGEMVLRVTGMSSGYNAQTGLMIRESLAADSRYSAVYLSGGACGFTSRATPGATSIREMNTGSAGSPRWLLLRRRGNTITAFHSTTGRAWTFAGGSTLTLPSSVYIGIAVAGGSHTSLNTSTFEYVDRPLETIVDNSSSSGVTITNTWNAGDATKPGYEGTGYLHDNNSGKGSKSIRYTPTFPSAGNYTVHLNWVADDNRAPNVPVSLVHANGTTSAVFDQRTPGNWRSLGSFRFSAGTGGHLTLSNNTSSGYVIADAVRFSATAPTVVILDNTSPAGVTGTGTWGVSSSVAGYVGANYAHDDNPSQKGNHTRTYTPVLPGPGTYEILMTWTADTTNRANNTPVRITHADGVTDTTVNQRIGGGASLGVFRYATGSAFHVRIANQAPNGTPANGYVIADSVRFESVTVPAQ